MAEKITRELIAAKAIIHTEAALLGALPVDRSFELPTGLYAASAALFAGFLIVMTLGFGNPELIVPLAICFVFLAMFFAVPAAMLGTNPATSKRAMTWARFQRDGIMTAFGWTSAGAATIQVLVLPALIFAWGVAVVMIAALVR